MRNSLGISLVAVVSFVAMSAGCSTESNGGNSGGASSEGSGASGSAGSGSSNYTCCINDAKYRCPSKSAFDQCAGFDIDGCTRACDTMDFACQDACFDEWTNSEPDPSACQEDASVDCGGAGSASSGPTGSTSSGGSCSDEGAACDLDDDCCSSNCTNQQCEGNGEGSPCQLDDDCDSGNCKNSVCEGNGAGSPCDLDDDCDSGNCAAGVCQ